MSTSLLVAWPVCGALLFLQLLFLGFATELLTLVVYQDGGSADNAFKDIK